MGKLGNRADATKQKVDAELKEAELAMLLASSSKLESLKPKIGDKEAFEKLIAVVRESTQKNEDVAALSQRLKSLGESVVSIAKTASTLLA